MKTVKITDVTGSLSKYAHEGESVVVTRRGKPVMAVMPLTANDDWESVSIAMNPKFMEIVERSRASGRDRGYLSLAEVRRRLARKTRVRRRRKSR